MMKFQRMPEKIVKFSTVVACLGKTFDADELRRVSVLLIKESSEVRVVDLDGLYASDALRWRLSLLTADIDCII